MDFYITSTKLKLMYSPYNAVWQFSEADLGLLQNLAAADLAALDPPLVLLIGPNNMQMIFNALKARFPLAF